LRLHAEQSYDVSPADELVAVYAEYGVRLSVEDGLARSQKRCNQ
jgi:hypothetical protein